MRGGPTPHLFDIPGSYFSPCTNMNEDLYPWPDPSDDDGGLLPSSVIDIARFFDTETNKRAVLTGGSVLRYAMTVFEMEPFPCYDGPVYSDFDLFVCVAEDRIESMLRQPQCSRYVDMNTFKRCEWHDGYLGIEGILRGYSVKLLRMDGRCHYLRRPLSIIMMDETIMQPRIGMLEGYSFGEAVVRRFDLDIVKGWLDFLPRGGIELRYPDDPISVIRDQIQRNEMTYIISQYTLQAWQDHGSPTMYARLQKYQKRGFTLIGIVFGVPPVFGEEGFRQAMPTLRFENARIDMMVEGYLFRAMSRMNSMSSSDTDATLEVPVVFRRHH